MTEHAKPTTDEQTSTLDMVNVGRTVEGNAILHNVTWRIDAGQQWVLLGANGSGKTTLARIAALRLHPSTGTIRVLGTELGRSDIRPLLPRVGYSAAALADQLRPDVTARDAVMTAKNGALEPWWHDYDDADRAHAVAALERVGVAALANQRFGSCSSGEKQRVLIARALMTDPALLVLDEPTSALDLGGAEAFVQTLDRLASQSDAPETVLVTHRVDEIPATSTHLAFMSEGEMVTAGPIDDTLTSSNLSEIFGLELVVERHGDGRWSARAINR